MSKEHALNQGQIDVLLKLYKFRFGTRELVAESLGRTNGTAIYSRLNILKEHGYVDMRFDKSYKLSGRAAEYYLIPKALRLLRDLGKTKSINDKIIKNSYNDKNASDSFIRRCLKIFAIANHLTSLYPGLSFITKRELTRFTYLPRPLPEAYLALKAENETQRFLLEFTETGTQPFLIKRRLQQLVRYYEGDDWGVTDSPFPSILYVCETSALQKRLIDLANREFFNAGYEFTVYATTELITQSDIKSAAVWMDIQDTNKLVSLTDISVNP